AGRLASAASVNVQPLPPHLVVAEYYPWYSLDGWRDPQFTDQPAQPYSSDDQAAVDRQAREAQAAGVDAFVVSWQGRITTHIERRTRMVLDGAQRAGIRAAVYFETYIVNPDRSSAEPVDLASMVAWFEDAVDLYGAHPAYLRVNHRPVIFIYDASLLTEAQ